LTKIPAGTSTVSQGRAEVSYVIPGDTVPGTHTIYATYVQNDHYMEGTGYNTAEIRIPTTITVDDVLASIGETATFRAYVKYNTTQNVNEGTVQFQLGGTNIGTPVSVSNGVATLQYEIPSNTTNGTNIKAIFIETNTYGASQSSNGTLSIREGTNVVVSNVSANRGTQATITASITDSEGEPVTSGQAQLYIDNTADGSPVNVVNGGVVFTYDVANNAVVGGHTIKISYLQNSTYDPADGTATLTVRTPTTLVPVNVSANKNSSVALVVRVSGLNNAPVPEGTVRFTVGNGEPIVATVGVNGEATITYEVPSTASGTITFTGVYVENTNYEGGTTATNGVLTIRKGVTIVVDSVKAELGDTVVLSSTLTDENSELVTNGTVNYEIE